MIKATHQTNSVLTRGTTVPNSLAALEKQSRIEASHQGGNLGSVESVVTSQRSKAMSKILKTYYFSIYFHHFSLKVIDRHICFSVFYKLLFLWEIENTTMMCPYISSAYWYHAIPLLGNHFTTQWMSSLIEIYLS